MKRRLCPPTLYRVYKNSVQRGKCNMIKNFTIPDLSLFDSVPLDLKSLSAYASFFVYVDSMKSVIGKLLFHLLIRILIV